MLRRSFFFILNFQILAFLSYSQPPIQWEKSLGGTSNEQAFCIRQTSDGGYIVAGIADSFDGDVTGHHLLWDCWLAKLSVTGNIEWQKCYGGSGEDEAFSVEQTSDGGYIVAGLSESADGDVTGNHGGWDCWIFKTDSAGNLQWQKSLGGTGVDGAYSVRQTPDGGYIVAGYSQSTDGDVTGNHGANDLWLLKLDNGGSLQWQKSHGGSNSDAATTVQLTGDGGYIMGGGTSSNDGDVTGNHGGGDVWLVRADSSGDILWQKCLGGSGSDYANSLARTNDGGFIISGHSSSNDGDVSENHGNNDYWIAKTDSAGNIQWQKSLGGTGTESAYSCEQTADGGYIITGGSFSNNGDVTGNHGGGDYWIVKTDSAGNIQWQKCLGGAGNDFSNSVIQSADGGYIIAGTAYSVDGDVTTNHDTSGITSDYWIVKLSPDAGIENYHHDDAIIIYPNPADEQFTIYGLRFGILKIEVYNVSGCVVYSQTQTPNPKPQALNLSFLTPGVYLLAVETAMGKRTVKFIKE